MDAMGLLCFLLLIDMWVIILHATMRHTSMIQRIVVLSCCFVFLKGPTKNNNPVSRYKVSCTWVFYPSHDSPPTHLRGSWVQTLAATTFEERAVKHGEQRKGRERCWIWDNLEGWLGMISDDMLFLIFIVCWGTTLKGFFSINLQVGQVEQKTLKKL